MHVPDPVRIVIAGGCHISGWPVGEARGMTSVLARRMERLGYRAAIAAVPHVALHHHHKAVAACLETSPDMVVLQLGHFELDRTFSSRVRHALRLPERTAGQTSTRCSLPACTELRYDFSFRIRSAARMAADVLTLHSLARPAELAERLAAFIGKVREVHGGPLLVLSPLPCADLVTFRYRLELAGHYERICAEVKVQYLDVLSRAAGPRRRRCLLTPGYFADNIHLGWLGHLEAGEAVADALLNLMPAPAQAIAGKCRV